MKEMLIQTAMIYGRRNAVSKRKNFIALFSEQIRRLGFNVKLDEGFNTSVRKFSAVYGTPKDAKAVFLTGYDTPTATVYPGHRYYPLNIRKSAKNNLIDTWLRVLIGVILLAGVILLTRLPFFAEKRIARYALIGLYSILFVFLLRGIDCRYNFNRNTSAVTLLYETAQVLKGDKKYAFGYVDDTVNAPLGYKRMADILKNDVANKDVVILEAIGDGDEVFLVHKDAQDEEAKRILSHFKDLEIKDISISEEQSANTILSYFPKTFVLTSGRMVNGEIECRKTRSYSSLGCDIDRLEALEKGILDWVGNRG